MFKGDKMEIKDYIKACVNYYGMIHEERISHIYCKHFKDSHMTALSTNDIHAIEKEQIFYRDGFFVHRKIVFTRGILEHLQRINGKPYHIPDLQTLEKYVDDKYYKKTLYIERLEKYVFQHLEKESIRVESLIEAIALLVRNEGGIQEPIDEFYRWNIHISENQIQDVIKLLMDVHNNTKMWTNNGFSPSELRAYKDRFKHTKRNDLCPCRSGKKFKHCCMKLGYINDDLGQLTYENPFLEQSDLKHEFEEEVLLYIEDLEYEDLDSFILDLYDPSYEAIMDDFMIYLYDDFKHLDPRIVAGAICKRLLVIHDIDNHESYLEDILRFYRVWAKRKEVKALYEELEIISFDDSSNENKEDFLLNLARAISEENDDSEIYINNDNYQALLNDIKKSAYDANQTEMFTDLSFRVKESDIEDKDKVYHLYLQITPFLPQTISLLLHEDLNDESKINLLKAYIMTYEHINSIDLQKPITGNESYNEHREYLFGLDTLAYIYKYNQTYDKALELYEKINKLDKDNIIDAKTSSLICLFMLGKYQAFEETLFSLDDHSIYKPYLDLLMELIKDEHIEDVYSRAYERSPMLMDIICQDGDDSLLVEEEREFLNDFYMVFISDQNKYQRLKKLHQVRHRFLA
jgi:hypothetical protein